MAQLLKGFRPLTRYVIIIMLLVLPSYSAGAADMGSILSTCSQNHSHVEMSKCLVENASTSEAALNSAEYALVNLISKRDNDEPELKGTAKSAFESGRQAFKIYRDKQCEFDASMAAGGNGAHDLRLACIGSLNTERSEQLQWTFQNWK